MVGDLRYTRVLCKLKLPYRSTLVSIHKGLGLDRQGVTSKARLIRPPLFTRGIPHRESYCTLRYITCTT